MGEGEALAGDSSEPGTPRRGSAEANADRERFHRGGDERLQL